MVRNVKLHFAISYCYCNWIVSVCMLITAER